mmetsp:Transcript_41687/g.30632  ORF Transcript_41687/g.30632 Transcript_41687/m.30632 type:complete len:236 (+) Transcript_41687:162-869(+)|eukprot:CAMPEP_0202963054 /NCGR_PEP_ID=MMETSP1396-20130829/7056_1 /ASSEMBLY_ACC=CAM_ASM_000872 /TAXON_ID= /ORGANISM="Pseudokeronopsis sp., Strain Brazil" /LENGTH=235 /DNA_ID=CAMNT_0049683977 /DNA_START=209 /DNA_END=916 /DNA_ORIENTATION=-
MQAEEELRGIFGRKKPQQRTGILRLNAQAMTLSPSSEDVDLRNFRKDKEALDSFTQQDLPFKPPLKRPTCNPIVKDQFFRNFLEDANLSQGPLYGSYVSIAPPRCKGSRSSLEEGNTFASSFQATTLTFTYSQCHSPDLKSQNMTLGDGQPAAMVERQSLFSCMSNDLSQNSGLLVPQPCQFSSSSYQQMPPVMFAFQTQHYPMQPNSLKNDFLYNADTTLHQPFEHNSFDEKRA